MPDYTIADAGQGGGSANRLPWPAPPPCHGDVFHVQHQFECLVNTLARIAQGNQSRCQKLPARWDGEPSRDRTGDLAEQLGLACKEAALARDVRTLSQWLGHDVLSLGGPEVVVRQEMFNFVTAELHRREHEDVCRIRPMRVALHNQRDALLAFARALDGKLVAAVASAVAHTPRCCSSLVERT